MQKVSNAFLSVLQGGNYAPKQLIPVVEFYSSDAVPPFDPASPLFLFGAAAVSGVVYRGREYKPLLKSAGAVKRTIKKQLSSFSLSLSNSSREVIDFEMATGFEGLICVCRLIDRSASVNLSDSAVEFTGRCKKPESFSKSDESASISVEQILSGIEINIPRRKLTIDDEENRAPSDPLFEGFRYTQRDGSVNFTEVVKKKFLFFFTKKKTVTRTLQYSSRSDAKADMVLPLVLGRAQIQLINFAAIDTGKEVQYLALACEGSIQGFVNLRSVTQGFTLSVLAQKLGLVGGTGNQINDDPNFIGAGVYSRTAYIRAKATGTAVDVDDAAPETVSVILGYSEIPIPDEAGVISRYGFSDNGVLQSRWILGDKNFFNLADAWLADDEHYREADYCDHILVDQSNTDALQLAASQQGIAGTLYRNFRSTGFVSGGFFRRNGDGSFANFEQFQSEPVIDFYTQTPINGDGGNTAPATNLRRRYTSNVVLSEQMKAIDFLYDVIFPAFNGYLVQKANGKLAVRVAKPADFAFILTASAVNATEIRVGNINPFATEPGRILIGANKLLTSEVRRVTATRYDTTVNLPISATGGVSSSATSLGGGTNTATAPNALLTVGSAAGAKTITINNYALTYNPSATDDTVTVAGFLAGLINSHNELNKYIKAVWNRNATVTVSSRIGFLTLDLPLAYPHLPAIANPVTAPTGLASSGGTLAAGAYQISYSFETLEGETLTSPVAQLTLTANQKIDVSAVAMPARVVRVNWYASAEAGGIRRKLIKTNDGAAWGLTELPKLDAKLEAVVNETAEELHRVAMAFADKASPQANLVNSNILKGTFKFPIGSRTASDNRIAIKYRSAVDDFALSELRINDRLHQKKIKKVNTRELNGAAIDNYHQARRIANQQLAETRDGNVFVSGTADGEALLLEEGDTICVTDESGRFVNFPCRVEDLDISFSGGYPSVSFTARKYSRKYFDDQVAERLVPLAIVTNSETNTEQSAAVIFQKGVATNTSIAVGVTNYSTDAKFRKVQLAADNLFTANLVELVHSAQNEVGLILTAELILARNTNLTAAETKFVRAAHSSNNATWGVWSNILTISYPAADGTGGTPPQEFPPSGGGGGTDGGFTGGHKTDPNLV